MHLEDLSDHCVLIQTSTLETYPPLFSSPRPLQGLRVEEQAVLVQCIALKMLTDFTLMYTSAVGLILRRDAETPARGGSPRGKTPRKDAPKHTGVLLRYLYQQSLKSGQGHIAVG
jgi:hypothetical protein